MIIIVVIDDQTWLRGTPCAGGEGRQSWMGVGKMRGRGERTPGDNCDYDDDIEDVKSDHNTSSIIFPKGRGGREYL